MSDLLFTSLVSGIGIAFLAGLLGCFIVWKKMAYFGDSLGHSTVLGIGFGILFGINYDISILLTVIIFALLLAYLKSKNILSNDVLLGVLAHGALAMGVILLSFSENNNFNLHSFLFGDILAVNLVEIYYILFAIILVYSIIIYLWRDLVLSIVSKDLAKSQNINNFMMDLVLVVVIGITVAVSIKIIGALLITSMLIIPAATAQILARDPKNMVIISIILAVLSIVFGILISYHFDIPSGPAVIITSFFIFFGVMFVKKI